MSKKNLYYLNLVFILIFLNFWDYILSREILNAMMLGLVIFAPVAFFWWLGKVRGEVFITLISIFEFVGLLVFVLEGFTLSGTAYASKSIFWVPFLVMAGINSFYGLKFYSEYRESITKDSRVLDKPRNREEKIKV